jgi:hypothetical protein
MCSSLSLTFPISFGGKEEFKRVCNDTASSLNCIDCFDLALRIHEILKGFNIAN